MALYTERNRHREVEKLAHTKEGIEYRSEAR